MHEFFKVEISGISPLLQHRFASEEPVSRRTVNNYDNNELVKKALYTDGDGNIVQPAIHIEACMIKAASSFRFQGKKTFKDVFKSGVFVHPELILHQNQHWVMDEKPVVINKSRIIRARPRFDDWSLEFEIEITDERITHTMLQMILSEAGKYHGIGDFRPRYGRFEIKRFERKENTPD